MEVCKPYAIFGDAINIGRLDLASKSTNIRESKIVRYDYKKIRTGHDCLPVKVNHSLKLLESESGCRSNTVVGE